MIRYDLRGIGKTPMVEGFYSHHEEDLRGLLDSLKVGRAHLVGCSMGEVRSQTSRTGTRRGSGRSYWWGPP